jgi:hypothetical protein
MIQRTIITLETLHCKRQGRGNQAAEPYFWLAMMELEQKKGIGKVSTLSAEGARVVTRDSQPGGQAANSTKVSTRVSCRNMPILIYG